MELGGKIHAPASLHTGKSPRWTSG